MESVSKAGMHYMQNITTISFDPKVAYVKPICTLGSKHARMKDILPARERGKEWGMREPFFIYRGCDVSKNNTHPSQC